MNPISKEVVFEMMKSKGFSVFENDSKPYNLNIIGIRRKNSKLDSFNDQLFVAWKYKGAWNTRTYAITTYPGSYYLIYKLLNIKGCAILAEGQYKGVYKLDLHQGKYLALCQRLGNVRVFRDKNKDHVFDKNHQTIHTGMYGINIHRANKDGCTVKVGPNSAGCQVFRCAEDFNEFIEICHKAEAQFGNKFTYTLIEEN